MTTWFQRFEDIRTRMLKNPRLSRFDRFTTPHTHPGLSVARMLVVKTRVVAVFVIRRIAQGRGRRQALDTTRMVAETAAGSDVLVIGSGPSASRLKRSTVVEAQKTGGILVVATNFFLASDLGKTITPDYLVWSDDIFHPSRSEKNPQAWEGLATRPQITLVTPWTWRRDIERLGIPNPVVYFDDDTLEGWSRNISPLHPRGYQGSTGQKAIAFATHLGARQTLIIGIDLSYFRHFTVDEHNRLFRNPIHLKGTDTGVAELTPQTLLGLADELYSASNTFRYLHTHFRGKNIINLDQNSLIDAFPKVVDSPYLIK